MTVTAEAEAYYRQLDRQRQRMLEQSFTNSSIPINSDHQKWLENKSLQSAATPGHDRPTAPLPSSSPTALVTMPTSTFPNHDQSVMMNQLPGFAAQVGSRACPPVYCSELTQQLQTGWSSPALGRPPHLPTQTLAPLPANNGPFAVCLLFDSSYFHPASWPGTPSLAPWFPSAPQERFERPGATVAGTTSRVVEELPKAETGDMATVEEDEEDGDEGEEESIQIRLLARKKIEVSAVLHRDAPANWISERLLGDSGVKVAAAKYATYQSPGGILLESQECATVWWQHGKSKAFRDEFMVHSGKRGAPDVILGKSWALQHGERIRTAQRRPESVRRAGVRPRGGGTPSSGPARGRRQGQVQLAERPRIAHRVVGSSRRAYVSRRAQVLG